MTLSFFEYMFTLTNDGNPKIRLGLNFNVNIQYIILKAKFHMLCLKNFFAAYERLIIQQLT